MLIEGNSKYLLKKTRAKAKMFEYNIPEILHARVEESASELLLIAIGAIGNISASILRSKSIEILDQDRVKGELEFSSKFFDSFLNSRIDDGSQDYYFLLGAIAYFLCDQIGSSKVMASKLNIKLLDLECNGIEKILANLLNDNFIISADLIADSSHYKELIKVINILVFYKHTKRMGDIPLLDDIRNYIYEVGTSLELLLMDSLLAIFIIKLNYSAINLLPKYTGLDRSDWENAILKGNLIQELWASQRKLGEMGIYKGCSGVIQMPTGSGKTKAISLIVYSSIISKRSNFTIIVAPFRALCREITYDLEQDLKFDTSIKIDQLSDVFTVDNIFFDDGKFNDKTVLVLTPEKLLYLLRQRTDLVQMIGLIIFDEGHMFDDKQRGTSYELLVSAIRGYLSEDIQKILISAVISNADEMNDWFNTNKGVVVSDSTIKTTEKQIAISDWRSNGKERFGYLYFLDPKNPEVEEFFVPRFVRVTEINKLGRETKSRYFPEVTADGKTKNNDIAIYYGINLCINGGIAVFCGTKITVNKILERILDIEKRGYDISNIIDTSCVNEINKISKLISDNYGTSNVYFKAAQRGAFAHHSNVSNGIRISVEYAMRKELIKFLICTSTLSQGVNLPIRYLIVSSIYQGQDKISVRDFYNLMGRAGRSGVYTEGSILLTETAVYNNRKTFNKWKWNGYKNLLDESNSEACTSNILAAIQNFDLGNNVYINFTKIIISYYEDTNKFDNFEKTILNNKEDFNYKLRYYYSNVMKTLNSIESFLLSYLSVEDGDFDEIASNVLKNTLGYYLASEGEKEELYKIFKVICNYIIENTVNSHQRYLYSKSLQGIKINKIIERFISDNRESLESCINELEVFELISQLIYDLTDNIKIKRLIKSHDFIELGELWLQGRTYIEIETFAKDKEIMILHRGNYKIIDLDDVIQICDSGLGYSSILLVTALSELYSSREGANEDIIKMINQLSSNLRYGLPDCNSISLYELGFSDRVVAQKMAKAIEPTFNSESKQSVKLYLRKNRDLFTEIIIDYPSVFIDRLNSI